MLLLLLLPPTVAAACTHCCCCSHPRLSPTADAAPPPHSFSAEDEEALNETLGELLLVLEQLDERIGPMLEQDGAHFNKR
jgi:hypothetical protein